eukprot:4965227-Alexandrium_andersonii.AAC.1
MLSGTHDARAQVPGPSRCAASAKVPDATLRAVRMPAGSFWNASMHSRSSRRSGLCAQRLCAPRRVQCMSTLPGGTPKALTAAGPVDFGGARE